MKTGAIRRSHVEQLDVGVGFAAGRPDESLQAALMRADAALYAAKAAGRDRVRGTEAEDGTGRGDAR